MNKAIYNITDFYPYYRNVHILTSLDGDNTWTYCGIGKFCDTDEEVTEFCKKYKVISIEKQ